MDQAYWDALAPTFGDDVMEVGSLDLQGRLVAALDRVASPRRSVADLGCGRGVMIPALLKRFRSVTAVDFSAELLALARKQFSESKQLRYRQLNLASEKGWGWTADVVLCVSVLIVANRARLRRFGDTIARTVRRGGTLILTVPALESHLHVYHTLVHLRETLGGDQGMSMAVARRWVAREVPSVLDGAVAIDGVPTKHWMREEIVRFVQQAGLRVTDVERVEYPWTSELIDPPKSLGGPYPWDWLVVARRR